jgi:mannose-1-phosphate guanylyltransferase/mannose-6-phosphate isomerase
MSRQGYPKQLLALLNDHSLLQNTVLRLNGLEGLAAPILVCNEAHRYLVQSQMTEIGYPDVQVILEPVGRNTAPAIALAALAVQGVNPEAMLLVLPSDHVITKLDVLHSGIRAATELATDGHLVTFGIEAAAPETGYGYIERAAAVQSGYHVERFVEKPDLERAQAYVDSGQYYWNSGMFVFQSQQFLKTLNIHAPLIAQCTEAAWQGRSIDQAFIRPNTKAFEDCPAESVDYAVMEVASSVAVVPLSAGWSDIGSWQSIWAVSDKDLDLNVSKGDVIFENTASSLVFAENRLVTVVGLEEVVVVETADAVLVAAASQSQQVKAVVDRLRDSGRAEHLLHRRVNRPWGWYEIVDEGPRHKTKRIGVVPGQRLSLQKHTHRAEHWVVVSGVARVTCDDQVFELIENQSTYIPQGSTHRLENPGGALLEIIEVQSGRYLGEDDIIRFDDAYGRVGGA